MSDLPKVPEPDGPALDVRRIVSTFDRHGVGNLLVGGLGATLHGAERVTQDIDVPPTTGAENLASLGEPSATDGVAAPDAPPATGADSRG